MPAFQFNVDIDGAALATAGLVLEWVLPPTFFITPLGLLTRGLIIGLGDQWQYDDDSTSPAWASADSSTDPGWVVSDI
jgi:hypothetical protein